MDVTHYRADCSITDWNLLPVDMAAALPIILVMAPYRLGAGTHVWRRALRRPLLVLLVLLV